MEKCVQCGKIAVVPPLCLGCMLEMNDEDYRIQAIVHNLKSALDDENGQPDEIKDLKIQSLKNAIGDAVEVLELILDEPHEYISTAELRMLRDNLISTLKNWDAL